VASGTHLKDGRWAVADAKPTFPGLLHGEHRMTTRDHGPLQAPRTGDCGCDRAFRRAFKRADMTRTACRKPGGAWNQIGW